MSTQSTTSAPWLTVVIPSFHGEQWIGESLQSICAEPTEGVEILLIDSGPTAEAVDIARTYCNRLRLRVFERPDLTSWQSKTNFAVALADSTHVCWLGVDDLWLPGRVGAIRGWIDSSPQSPLHLAPSAVIDRNGRHLGLWQCPLPPEVELPAVFLTERLLVQNFIGAPAPVFRKDAWLACGGLDESLWYTADWDVWLKLAASGRVWYHERVTTAFRVHGESLTATGSRNIADFEDQMRIVVKRHIGTLPNEARHVERVAQASIAVNAALAGASVGNFKGWPRAASLMLRLGMSGMRRYLRDSRVFERVTPRLRAKLKGVF